MKILYSFNKRGFEAEYWAREIEGASTPELCFVPFNHDSYLDPNLYIRAQLLDNLYFARHSGLTRLYAELERLIAAEKPEVLLVDNCVPYHPDYLRTLPIYKVLRIADGPVSAYDRDFAYLHAFDHVLYHSPAYSRDLTMDEKLRYCGARRIDLWTLGSFDALCDRSKTEYELMKQSRPIDIVFVGALFPGKMPLLAKVKKVFGRRMRLHGLANLKRNIYFNARFGFPGWIKPLRFDQYVPLYQSAKIGINIHNRGDYTVGGYRLFDLPANGVMQISDGGEYLSTFFKPGEEIVSYRDADELIDKIIYYLKHDDERDSIARSGFIRVNKQYRMKNLLQVLGPMLRQYA